MAIGHWLLVVSCLLLALPQATNNKKLIKHQLPQGKS